METLKINMLADARTTKIVGEDFEAINGLVTLFKDVPVVMELALFDMDNQPYLPDALNGYEWGFVIANDYNKATAPQLRADSVIVAENVLKIEITNMNTVELNLLLGDEKSIRLGAELTGKKDGVDNWVLQFNVSVRNRRDSIGTPTPVTRDYYTKTEVDEKLENITPEVDLTDYYTKAETNTLIDESQVDLTPYQLKQDAFSGNYEDLTNKPTIPILPDNITTLGNTINTANSLLVLDYEGKVPSNLLNVGNGYKVAVDYNYYYDNSTIYVSPENNKVFIIHNIQGNSFTVDLSPIYSGNTLELNFEIELKTFAENSLINFVAANGSGELTWLDEPDFSKKAVYRICIRCTQDYATNVIKFTANVAYMKVLED